MKAIEELPDSDKRDLFPIFLIRPWLKSHYLEKTVERIEKSIGRKSYILDLDTYYSTAGKNRPAQRQFRELFLSNNGFENWFSFVEQCDSAIPCLRLEEPENRNLPLQIDRATNMERGFLARIRYQRTENVEEVVESVCSTEHSEFAFVLDVGWAPDILIREAWVSGLIEYITDRRPEVPIVVSGSSFPDSFSDFALGEQVSVDERSMFARLVRRHNAAKLIYGDWGSAREPTDGGPMRPVPRIDVPTSTAWSFFRLRAEDGGYPEAARTAIRSDDWNSDLDIWGTYMIHRTALNEPFSISTPQKAAASRINIHLHTQLRFYEPQLLIETEDDYVE